MAMSGDNEYELAELEGYRLELLERIEGAERQLEIALGDLRSLRHQLRYLKRRMRFAALLARYATGRRLLELEYDIRAFRQFIFQLEDVQIPDALEISEIAVGRRDGLVDLAESLMNYLHEHFKFIGP